MRLTAYLKEENERPSDFARRVKASPSAICRIMNGERLPSLGLAVRIELATAGKVRPRDWDPEGRSSVKNSDE